MELRLWLLSTECKGTARAGLFPKGQRARSEPMVVTAPTGSSPIMLKQGRGDGSNRFCWQPSSRQAGQSLVHSGIQPASEDSRSQNLPLSSGEGPEYRLKWESWPMDGR